jgi:type I restriction enzyme, S subunit
VRRLPLKHLVRINDRTLPETTDSGVELRYIDIGAVGRGVLLHEPEMLTFGEAPSRARRLVRSGDTIISTVRTYLRAVWPVEDPTSDLVVSTGFAVLTPGPEVNARYLGWLAQSDVVVEEVVARSVGVSYPAINAVDIGEVQVPLVSPAAQRAIADFLDAETARIDALITKKRQLMERLLDCRVVTTHAGVSGRLTSPDGHANSSLPWLLSYPKDWRSAKLTLVARLGTGHTPSREHPEWWIDCSIPWVTTGEVRQIRNDRIEYLYETREKVSALGVANSSATVHPAGTVVLSRTASAGFSAIMGTDMATSQDFVTWTCGPLLEPRFLLLCLRAMRTDLLDRLAQGSTHKTIYMPDIESIRIPLPPMDEQRRIVDETWRGLRPIDAAVDRLRQQVELLLERRQALITAAVNGQLGSPRAAA